MKTLLISAALLALAGATAVSAQPALRLSDAQFVKAAHCKGVVKAGAGDTKAIDDVLKANRRARADFVLDKATNAQNEGQSEFGRADDTRKAEMLAACQAFAS